MWSFLGSVACYLLYALVAAVLVQCSVALYRMFVAPRDYRGKHVFITGGSTGIGLSIAHKFARRGANVVVCSRTESKLKAAVAELEKKSRVDSSQRFQHVVCDVTSRADVARVLEQSAAQLGPVDVLVACAGASTPGYFVEQDWALFERAIQLDYFGTLYPVKIAAKMMVDEKRAGEIIMVSSAAAFMTFVGYSTYSPAKFAVRGLAETLRNELLPHNIRVHLLCPCDTDTPGFAEENRTKPVECVEISKQGSVVSADTIAAGLMAGLDRGDFFIGGDFGSQVLFALGNGAANPRSGFSLLEVLLLPLLAVAGWFVRHTNDTIVKKFFKKPQAAPRARK